MNTNLIGLNFQQCLEMAHTAVGKHEYNLLMSLVELQNIAYADATKRNPRTILRAYNQPYTFAIEYVRLFSLTNKPRSVFGMSYHALANHLPEMLWLVNGRSILAEQAEAFSKAKVRSLVLYYLKSLKIELNFKLFY